MLTKSEIALWTITVLGTLAAWLAMPRPSPASPIDGPPGMACGAPLSPGEVHVCDDRIALIEVRASDATAITVLAGTTLSPTSSVIGASRPTT